MFLNLLAIGLMAYPIIFSSRENRMTMVVMFVIGLLIFAYNNLIKSEN